MQNLGVGVACEMRKGIACHVVPCARDPSGHVGYHRVVRVLAYACDCACASVCDCAFMSFGQPNRTVLLVVPVIRADDEVRERAVECAQP